MSQQLAAALQLPGAFLPRTGRRATGRRTRPVNIAAARLPPKGFNVSGFSEILVLYFLNQIRSQAGSDLGSFFGTASQGIMTPVFTRQRDASSAQSGLNINFGINQDITTDFVFDYVMHMSAWLYTGFMVCGFFNDQSVATMTLTSVRARLQHVKGTRVLRDLFDTGTIADGGTGDLTRSLAAKLPFVEYFAVGDIFRCIQTIRSTTNGTGTGSHLAVQSWGAQDGGVQPHIFLHAQPTQETGNQALFARRI